MMVNDDASARYLASGPGDDSRPNDRLDLMRDVLADQATWAEPPPQVVDGLLAAVGAANPNLDSPPVDPPHWPLVAAVLGSAAAVIALVLATIGVLDSVEETVVAMTGTELEAAAGGRADVRPTGSGWWIRLDVNGLPPAPEGSFYEGWVWSDEGEGVSIGTFHLRGGDAPVVLWSGVEMADYPSIWVTLENEDDGPEASGLVVMTGRMPDTDDA